MGLADGLNQMMIEEMVQGALAHIKDKALVKEKATEFLGYLEKLDDDMLVMLARVDEKVSICIGKKDDVQFTKEPSFIDLETILINAAESL